MVKARKRIPGRIFTLVLFLLVVSPRFVFAAEWYIDPTLSAGYEYDDNRFLRVRDEQSASTWTFSPSVVFGRRTESFNLAGAGRVEVEESNRSELDRTNLFFRLFPHYQTERHTWRLNTTYTRDSTLRRDITDPQNQAVTDNVDGDGIDGSQPDVDGDTNIGEITTVDVTRNVVSLAPSWDWNVSRRTRLGLGYRYIETFYGDTGDTGEDSFLSDSRSHIGTAGLEYRLSEADGIGIDFSFRRFENDRPSQFDTYSAALFFNHRFSETLRADLSIGAQHIDGNSRDVSTGVVSSGSDTTVSFRAGLRKRFESSQLTFGFQRTVAPNAFGDALETNRFDIRWTGDISPRWSYGLAARAFRNEELGGLGTSTGTGGDRYYAQVDPTLSYELIRNLFLDVGYRFRWQDRENAEGTAISNAVLVSLNYRWDRLSISR